MKEPQEETQLQLLKRIDSRLERFEESLPRLERKAAAYGAVSGAITGGLVTCGLLIVRQNLGI